MHYKYEKEVRDYSDLASGRVFHSLPGYPAFPVRLASEIFQRCIAHREALYKVATPCNLYDPCCGAAYHLSVLAFLHGEHLHEIIASDIDEKAVAVAKRNLGLLNIAGMEERIAQLTRLREQYGKDSHKEALASANMLKSKISASSQKPVRATKVFQASATDGHAIRENIKSASMDLVFTDVPYGRHSQWHDEDVEGLTNPLWSMLGALTVVLSPSSVLAIVSDKGQKVSHEGFQRIEHFQTGKRRVVILKPKDNE